MKISINRDDEVLQVDKITVFIGGFGFKISVNRFEELIVNKITLDSRDSSIVIKPSVSNEIRIS